MVTIQPTFGLRTGQLARQIVQSADSVGRLSSGNRIQNAGDDVSGLSVATQLRAQTTTLRQELENGVQASSLLQVASDGFSRVQDILQRQATLATQANSGSITDVERSFLAQEFSALGEELDRIVLGTNFNGITLLNGIDNVNFNDTIAQKARAVIEWTGNPTNGQTFRTQDTAFRFRTVPIPGDPLSVEIGATIEETVLNLAEAIRTFDQHDNLKAYEYTVSGTELRIASISGGKDARRLVIEDQGSSSRDNFTVTQGQRILNTAQGYYTLEAVDEDLALGANSVKVTGITDSSFVAAQAQTSSEVRLTIANPTGGINHNDEIRIDSGFGPFLNFRFRDIPSPGNFLHIEIGDNNEETLANAAEVLNNFQNAPLIDTSYFRKYVIQQLEFSRDGLDLVIRHKGTGDVPDAQFDISLVDQAGLGVLSSSTLDSGTDSGVNTNGIINPDFVGKVSGFESTYLADNLIETSLKVGDATYSATISDTSFAGGDQRIFFTSEDNGYFTVDFVGGAGPNVTNQNQADLFAQELDSVFSALNFNQERSVLGYNGAGELDGSSLFYETDDFTGGLNVTNIEVQSASEPGQDARVIIEASGKTFEYIERDFGNNEVVSNDSIVFRSIAGGPGQLTLTNVNQKYDLNTKAGAQDFAQNLAASLVNLRGSGVQVGVNDADGRVNLGYEGFSVNDLFRANDLSIGTQAEAVDALEGIKELIEKVTAQQAAVGSSQARLEYIIAEKEGTLLATDSARAAFADTDIAAESSLYAQLLVQQNAAIAVSAQANILNTQVLALLSAENSALTES